LVAAISPGCGTVADRTGLLTHLAARTAKQVIRRWITPGGNCLKDGAAGPRKDNGRITITDDDKVGFTESSRGKPSEAASLGFTPWGWHDRAVSAPGLAAT